MRAASVRERTRLTSPSKREGTLPEDRECKEPSGRVGPGRSSFYSKERREKHVVCQALEVVDIKLKKKLKLKKKKKRRKKTKEEEEEEEEFIDRDSPPA